MTTEITLSSQLIGLAAAGAAALGMSLSEGLLQPMGKLAAIRTLPRREPSPRSARRATAAPVLEETPEHRAALPHVEAPAAAPAAAPVRKAAPTTGLLELFGDGGESERQPQG